MGAASAGGVDACASAVPGSSADSCPAAAPGGILAAEGVPGAAVVAAVADAIDGTNDEHCVEMGACAAVSGQTQQRNDGQKQVRRAIGAPCKSGTVARSMHISIHYPRQAFVLILRKRG